MKIEETRRVYITLTKEEREILDKASILIADIHDNMNNEDGLAFVDEDVILDSYDSNEIRDIVELLLNMIEFKLEII